MYKASDRPSLGETSLKPRVLLYRYSIALGLIFLFISASHLFSVSVINEIKRSSDLISKSINQKTTVERVVSFAEMAQTLRTQASVERLLNQVDELERTHESLAQAAREAEPVERLYFTGGRGPALDPVMRKFIADARLVAAGEPVGDVEAALKSMRLIGDGILSRALAEANEGHQLQAKGLSRELSLIQSAAFALAILVLLLEALLIFLPTHRAVRHTLEVLSAQAARLELARDALKARNTELQSLRSAAEHEALHDPVDQAGEPPRLRARGRPADPKVARQGARDRDSSISIWTGSRRSTTRLATPPATPCCGMWAMCCANPPKRAISSRGSAATSLWSCGRATAIGRGCRPSRTRSCRV